MRSKVILSSSHVHMYRPASVCGMNRVYHGTYLVKTDTSVQHTNDFESRLLSFASAQPHIKVLSPLLCFNPMKRCPKLLRQIDLKLIVTQFGTVWALA